ncbi:Uncharacterized protein ACO02O_07924 [Dirofilaria immitis]
MKGKIENKSIDDLLCATKELLSIWMTTYPNAALNNLSTHEIRNITASQRIESIGLKNFEAFFSNTHSGEDYQQNNSMQSFQCKFTPSMFDVSNQIYEEVSGEKEVLFHSSCITNFSLGIIYDV